MKVNQTRNSFLELIQENGNLKGVGISMNRVSPLYVDNSKLAKSIKKDVSYAEALAWARDSVVFKYIPYGVKIKHRGQLIDFISYESIPEEHWVCVGKCQNSEDCFSEVCICVQGECH